MPNPNTGRLALPAAVDGRPSTPVFTRRLAMSAAEVTERYVGGTLTLHVHYAAVGAGRASRASACALIWPASFPSPFGAGPVAPDGQTVVEIVRLIEGLPLTVARIPSQLAVGQQTRCRPRRAVAGSLCLVASEFLAHDRFASVAGELTFQRDGAAMLVSRSRASSGAHLRITCGG